MEKAVRKCLEDGTRRLEEEAGWKRLEDEAEQKPFEEGTEKKRLKETAPITYNRRFLLSVAQSPVIGDRHDHEEIHEDTADTVADGGFEAADEPDVHVDCTFVGVRGFIRIHLD